MGILIMKSLKPLAALVGLLVLSGSANAVNVYNDKGTRFDVNGQFRLKTQVTSKDHEMRMRDDGSRIGFFGSHELTNDIKVFGKLEWGSDTQKTNSDNKYTNFDMFNRVGYVGFSHRDYGQIQFGRTYIPIDWVKKSSYGYGNTGVFYFSDVLSRSVGSQSNGVGKNNFMTRLPQTIFIETNRYEGFKLAATVTGKDGKDEKDGKPGDRKQGDIRNAYSIVGFYKSTFGLEFDGGYSSATGEQNFYDGPNKGKQPENSILAFGAEYFFPGREFSIGLDYGQSRAKNSSNVVAQGAAPTSSYSVKGDWKADLYGVGVKWHWDRIESGMYAGYYLRDGDANTYNYKKETYTVGVDKRFAVSKYNNLRLFAEMAYDDARSDSEAYEDKKQYIFETGMRLYF
ncbi:porin [Proteus mirabilis]|uniref:Porin n=2 Tax=Morganellaceae TaxID=1903414 RepID=A0A6G6SEL4_PROVU|nr:porin [Proteus mirabilis]QIF92963.1 porin [Proteus vulgaris]QPN89983.1 porin [Proteus vulgaris]CRL62527.1 Outer membrane protein C precursor [Proteus vulgaris]SUC13973.1 outer membrane protein [Proteus vulgaris]